MQASEFTKEGFPKLRNIPVLTSDGEELGKVGDAYYDEDSGRLEAVAVAGDALGVSKRVIPVQGATIDDDGLRLPYGREDIAAAPEAGDDLDETSYGEVSSYYRERSPEIVRSEEEAHVSKQGVEAGSVRVRKWVETEPVELDVELQHETARVTREEINEPVSDAQLGEDEVEVELRSEQPVVRKETVAKERIGIEKDVATEQEQVTAEVRKERVDVDEEGSK